MTASTKKGGAAVLRRLDLSRGVELFDKIDKDWKKRISQDSLLDEVYRYKSSSKKGREYRVEVHKEGESWFGSCTPCPHSSKDFPGDLVPCKHIAAVLLLQPEFDSGGGSVEPATEAPSESPSPQSTERGLKPTDPPETEKGTAEGGDKTAPPKEETEQGKQTKTRRHAVQKQNDAVQTLFKEASNRLAYAKTGFYGPQGSGKTMTGMLVAIGLAKLTDEVKPVYFVDTETGSDFFVKRMKDEGIPFYQVKTRAFRDLLPAIAEAEKAEAILVIDSVSHFWDELLSAYDKKFKRHGRFQFQDWAAIKGEWRGSYTTPFVAASCHIIVCGRQQAVYEEFWDDQGKKDIIVVGDRMRAEKEFGYEPHLVLKMESLTATAEQLHEATTRQERKGISLGSERLIKATVIKDRADMINGKVFTFPTFEDLWPHYQILNLGGNHLALETGRTSEALFNNTSETMRRIHKQRTIALEEIKGELVAVFPSRDQDSIKIKTDITNAIFGTRSWTAVEEMDLDDLEEGLAVIREALLVIKFKLEQKKVPDMAKIVKNTRAAIEATRQSDEASLDDAVGGTPKDLKAKEKKARGRRKAATKGAGTEDGPPAPGEEETGI